MKMKLKMDYLAHVRAVLQGIDWRKSAERYLPALGDMDEGAEVMHEAVLRLSASILRLQNIDVHWSDLDPKSQTLIDQDVEIAFAQYCETYGDGFSQDELFEQFKSENEIVQIATLKRKRKIECLKNWLIKLEIGADVKSLDGLNFQLLMGSKLGSKLSDVGIKCLEDAKWMMSNVGDWRLRVKSISESQSKSIAIFIKLVCECDVGLQSSGPSHELEASLVTFKKNNDLIEQWVSSHERKRSTQAAMKLELCRFSAWLEVMRHGCDLILATELDCATYKSELASFEHNSNPTHPRVRVMSSSSSRRQTEKLVKMFYAWCEKAGKVTINPWKANGPVIRTKNGRLKQNASQVLLDHLNFIEGSDTEVSLRFATVLSLEISGMKMKDILAAKLMHIKITNDSSECLSSVKNCFINGNAKKFLLSYLSKKETSFLNASQAQWPVVSALTKPDECVGYQAIHESMKNMRVKIEMEISKIRKRNSKKTIRTQQKRKQREKLKLNV